jgi:hypothetical protein
MKSLKRNATPFNFINLIVFLVTAFTIYRLGFPSKMIVPNPDSPIGTFEQLPPDQEDKS